MNFDEAKRLAGKMVNDMAESIVRVANYKCDEDDSHVGRGCAVVYMENKGNGRYKVHIAKEYTCCMNEALSGMSKSEGMMVEGSMEFLENKDSIAVFVCIEQYVIGMSIRNKSSLN